MAKTAQLLTVSQATSRARRATDRIMPGVNATVDSRFSHDLTANTPLVITTVTFPRETPATLSYQLVKALSEFGRIEVFNTRIVITRAR